MRSLLDSLLGCGSSGTIRRWCTSHRRTQSEYSAALLFAPKSFTHGEVAFTVLARRTEHLNDSTRKQSSKQKGRR